MVHWTIPTNPKMCQFSISYIFGFYKWNFACISFKIDQLPAQQLVSQNTQLSSLHERNNADIQIKDGTLLVSLQTSFGKCYNLNSSIYQVVIFHFFYQVSLVIILFCKNRYIFNHMYFNNFYFSKIIVLPYNTITSYLLLIGGRQHRSQKASRPFFLELIINI